MARKSRHSHSKKRKSRSRRRHGGLAGPRLGRTLAKAVVPFGLFMTQKHMQKRKSRRSRKGRKTRRR